MSERAQELARRIAHQVWQKYDDQFGYRTEKQEANANFSSAHPDNIWSFWGQFDADNHLEFLAHATRAVVDDEPGADELLGWVIDEVAREARTIAGLRDEYGINL